MNVAAAENRPGVEISLTPPSKAADALFRFLAWLMAMTVVALVVLVGWKLFQGSRLSIQKFGLGFLTNSNWDPVNGDFGAVPFIFGTFVSSFLGLLIAVPLSLATAIFLTELSPAWVRQPAISLIEMLAAVPSVILGLWGIFVMVPWLRDHPFKALNHVFGFLPIFRGPVYGVSILSAAVIISIMIIPIITSIAREVFLAVPQTQREAAFALGATRWEVTRLAVLRNSVRGIFGAAMLGLGRALGETMAVTMVIGNRPEISKSLFAPGYTLASAIANEFAEATSDIHTSALFELALVLLLVTIATNILARVLIGAVGTPRPQHQTP
jgi:phosphate transport system permease protein